MISRDPEMMMLRVLCVSLLLTAVVGTSLAAWAVRAGPTKETVSSILAGGVRP